MFEKDFLSVDLLDFARLWRAYPAYLRCSEMMVCFRYIQKSRRFWAVNPSNKCSVANFGNVRFVGWVGHLSPLIG